MNDLKFALRQLLRSPGFAFVAIVTLALGIGANAAIVTMIQTVVFKPIVAKEPNRLVGIYQHDVDNPRNFQFFSLPDFLELREDKSALKEIAAFNHAQVAIREGDFVRRVTAHVVSINYFSTLGVTPILGRAFVAEEETRAANSVVLSYAFWQRLGGRADVVGSKLKLAQGDFEIVGVMPESFIGVNATSPPLYFPSGAAEILWGQPNRPSRALIDRGEHVFMVFGRMQDGLNRQGTNERLKLMSEKHRFGDPRDKKGREIIATDVARFNFSNAPSRFVKQMMPIASLALGLSITVLGVACLNLANMLLARGAARRKEIAVRLAIGASRARILRQLLCEGFILAIVGGLGGIVIAIWSTSSIAAVVNSGVDAEMFRIGLVPDLPVLGALFGLCALATILFALGPAWKLASLDVNEDLKQHGAADVDRKFGRFGVKSLLVVGQLALSLALLVAAGLFARSAVAAMHADPGFKFGQNFVAKVDTGVVNYEKERAIRIFNEAEERIATLPGVEAVSSAMFIPFGQEGWTRDVQLGGAPRTGEDNATRSIKDGKALQVKYNVVGGDYFRALGVPLLRGRDFTRSESESKPAVPVAVITKDVADQLFGEVDPVGRTIQFPNGDNPIVMQVVGVAAPILWDLFEKTEGGMVVTPRGQDFQSSMRLHVRVLPNSDPVAIMDLVRKTLRDIDSNIPLVEMKPLTLVHSESMSVRMTKIGAMLFGAFGVVAMLLGFLGVYGLKAYAVARRTREIGIRMALGATARDVVRMIVGEGARIAVVGLALGLGLAFAVGKATGKFLYGVDGIDPVTFAIVPVALAVVTMIACWLPARRATRVNPMTALRCE